MALSSSSPRNRGRFTCLQEEKIQPGRKSRGRINKTIEKKTIQDKKRGKQHYLVTTVEAESTSRRKKRQKDYSRQKTKETTQPRRKSRGRINKSKEEKTEGSSQTGKR